MLVDHSMLEGRRNREANQPRALRITDCIDGPHLCGDGDHLEGRYNKKEWTMEFYDE